MLSLQRPWFYFSTFTDSGTYHCFFRKYAWLSFCWCLSWFGKQNTEDRKGSPNSHHKWIPVWKYKRNRNVKSTYLGIKTCGFSRHFEEKQKTLILWIWSLDRYIQENVSGFLYIAPVSFYEIKCFPILCDIENRRYLTKLSIWGLNKEFQK